MPVISVLCFSTECWLGGAFFGWWSSVCTGAPCKIKVVTLQLHCYNTWVIEMEDIKSQIMPSRERNSNDDEDKHVLLVTWQLSLLQHYCHPMGGGCRKHCSICKNKCRALTPFDRFTLTVRTTKPVTLTICHNWSNFYRNDDIFFL